MSPGLTIFIELEHTRNIGPVIDLTGGHDPTI